MTVAAEALRTRDTAPRLDQVHLHFARTDPDRLALLGGETRLTYDQLETAVDTAAAALDSLEIRSGDRIMLVSENCIALCILLLAASRIGAWAVIANPRLTKRELEQIRDHSGARRMVFASATSKEAAAHADAFAATETVIGTYATVAITALNVATAPEPGSLSSNDVALLLYTSGTTGVPKGVMLTHENLLVSAFATADFWTLQSGDRNYLVLPMSHIVGSCLFLAMLSVGGSIELVPRFDPPKVAAALASGSVTVLNGVPATYQKLLEFRQASGMDRLESGALRIMTVAGAPLDVGLKRRLEREFGISLLNGYGITECSPGISGVRPDDCIDDHSVGTLIPGVEARLKTTDGDESASGEIGELHVRGLNVMKGYYRAPELTEAVIDSEGWFNTGDLARFEGDRLFIVGRTKEMIIRSGFNVYPAEIEGVLAGHPDVVQCAVVGRQAEGNEEVVSFVQLAAGCATTVGDISAFLRERLAPYKRPSEIIVLDVLPASSTGKLLKHKMKALLEERRALTQPANGTVV